MKRETPAASVDARDGLLGEIDKALHDLCQPLTTLQCRLEMAELVGSLEAYREGVEEGLAQCHRIVVGVRTIRSVVQRSSDGPLPGETGAQHGETGAQR